MKTTIIITTILFILLAMTNAQSQGYSEALHANHDTYKEATLKERRFKHKDIVPLIENLRNTEGFEVKEVGKSTEKRAIYQVKIGTGKTKVLLWSQMHGDEATATMAMFDIFKFFKAKDEMQTFKDEILKTCTLYFVPMLNPDGAERWNRRTALDIDMNRDAVALRSPEARILKNLQQTLKPDFGFNLHDKDRRYSVGNSGKLATISFLATAYNEQQEMNETRKKAAQLIVVMNKALQKFIPDSVGKWPSDFEPRAFGDNIQKWGTSLVLIESGGYKNDPEKQYIRTLNFVAILTGLQSIAQKSYEKENIEPYQKLPENGRAIFDLIIRNVEVNIKGQTFRTDVAINRYDVETNLPQKFYIKSSVEDMGDLSVFFGTDEIDGSALTLESKEELKLKAKGDFILKQGEGVKYIIKNGEIIK